MRRVLLAVLLAGCSSESDDQLPSATFTPHLNSQETSVACGSDHAFNGSPTWDLRWGYTYDGDGRMVAGAGNWAQSTVVDTFAYTYAGDKFTSYQYTSGLDSSQWNIAATWSGDDLTTYTFSYASPSDSDSWTYVMSGFIGPNMPTREDVVHGNDPPFGYTLVYDATQRLVEARPDVGPSYFYTYDDAALTLTIDYDNGAMHDVLTYDADFKLLSDVATGTSTDFWHYSTTYDWDADRLLGSTTYSGSYDAPHTLELAEVMTMRYDCSVARTNAGVTTKRIKPSVLLR